MAHWKNSTSVFQVYRGDLDGICVLIPHYVLNNQYMVEGYSQKLLNTLRSSGAGFKHRICCRSERGGEKYLMLGGLRSAGEEFINFYSARSLFEKLNVGSLDNIFAGW